MDDTQEYKPNKTYELAYLVNPQTPEGEARAWFEKLSGLVASAEGAVKEMPEPKRQILAYPILHHKQAFFGWLTFTAPPETPAKIHESLKHDQILLRVMIIEEQRHTKPRIPQKPKPIQKMSTAIEPPQAEEKIGEQREVAPILEADTR